MVVHKRDKSNKEVKKKIQPKGKIWFLNLKE